jgi:hypothetical protein
MNNRTRSRFFDIAIVRSSRSMRFTGRKLDMCSTRNSSVNAEIASNFLAVSLRFIRSEEIRNDFNRSFQTEDLLRLVPETFRNCRSPHRSARGRAR